MFSSERGTPVALKAGLSYACPEEKTGLIPTRPPRVHPTQRLRVNRHVCTHTEDACEQDLDTRLVGSGKDIGKDKPAFGWELEPCVAFGSISGNASSGEIQDKKECENMRWPCGLGSS